MAEIKLERSASVQIGDNLTVGDLHDAFETLKEDYPDIPMEDFSKGWNFRFINNSIEFRRKLEEHELPKL